MVSRLPTRPGDGACPHETGSDAAYCSCSQEPLPRSARRPAEETSKVRSNRLIQEKSPYLLQHAYNPVDWYPWGEEAFRLAREKKRPIFLSVGYSTCYWCHVMEREVFEDPGIADLMNRYFVNIKVDREERPDVDRIYMSALLALTGSGGWPMSMFLTPELEPFFGRTYVPPDTFRSLIGRIHEVWVEHPDDIAQAGRQLTELLREQTRAEAGDALLEASILKKGYESIRAGYDETYGGFGRGNKFPRPVVFNFLLRYHRREAKSRALEMTLTTLERMAASGIFDHLEGGFHRYAVDRQWRVPHFEKMLYDQAQLVNSYLEAYQLTRNPLFASVARSTLDYVSRRLTHPPGGFLFRRGCRKRPGPGPPQTETGGRLLRLDQGGAGPDPGAGEGSHIRPQLRCRAGRERSQRPPQGLREPEYSLSGTDSLDETARRVPSVLRRGWIRFSGSRGACCSRSGTSECGPTWTTRSWSRGTAS